MTVRRLIREWLVALALVTSAVTWCGIGRAQTGPVTMQGPLILASQQIGTPQTLGAVTQPTGNVSSITITTTNNILTGDLVVVGVQVWSAAARTVSSVSDGTNSYSYATSVTTSAGQIDGELWYKSNAAAVASGASIVVTFSAATTGTLPQIAAATRVSGVVASPLDQTAQQGTTSSAPTVTTGTLAQANEIAFGVSSQANGGTAYSEASGFTNLYSFSATNSSSTGTMGLGYKKVSATTAITYAPTFAASRLVVTNLGTFKGF